MSLTNYDSILTALNDVSSNYAIHLLSNFYDLAYFDCHCSKCRRDLPIVLWFDLKLDVAQMPFQMRVRSHNLGLLTLDTKSYQYWYSPFMYNFRNNLFPEVKYDLNLPQMILSNQHFHQFPWLYEIPYDLSNIRAFEGGFIFPERHIKSIGEDFAHVELHQLMAVMDDDVPSIQSIFAGPGGFRHLDHFMKVAALFGSIAAFKFLSLNHGKITQTTLEFAVVGGNIEIIQLCLENGAGIAPNLLYIATKYWKNSTFDWLVDNHQLKWDRKLLTVAISSQNIHVLQLYLNDIVQGPQNSHRFVFAQERNDIFMTGNVALLRALCSIDPQIKSTIVRRLYSSNTDLPYPVFNIIPMQILVDLDLIECSDSAFLNQCSKMTILEMTQYCVGNQRCVSVCDIYNNIPFTMIVCQQTDLDLSTYPLEIEYDICSNTSKGQKALQTILSFGKYKFVSDMISHGIQIPYMCGTSKSTLHHLFQLCGSKQYQYLLYFDSPSVDYNRQFGRGPLGEWTFMQLFLFGQYDACLIMLLEGGETCELNEYGSMLAIMIDNNMENSLTILLESRHQQFQQPLFSSALVQASVLGRFKMISELFHFGANPNFTDDIGDTPLHTLLQRRCHITKQIFDCFIQHGLDIHAVNNKGETLLHNAVSTNSLSTVSMLLSAGADPNYPLPSGQSLLQYAFTIGDIGIAKVLVECGATNWNEDTLCFELLAGLNLITTDEVDKLMTLSDYNELAVPARLRHLLEQGNSVDSQDKEGKTPLIHAIIRSNTYLVKLLISHHADPDLPCSSKITPLMYAFQNINDPPLSIIYILLNLEVDLEARDSLGNSVIHHAVRCIFTLSESQLNPIDLLLDKSPDIVNAVGNDGVTPIMISLLRNNIDLFQNLMAKGANLNAQRTDGMTAIMSHIDFVPYIEEDMSLLLTFKPDLSLANSKGMTAANLAVKKANYKVLEKLIEAGAPIDHRDHKGRTLLMHAAKQSSDCIRLIGQTSVNEIDHKGRTALIHAARSTHPARVELLLEMGAEIDHKDCDGRTALHHAVLCNEDKNLALLISRGANLQVTDDTGATPLDIAESTVSTSSDIYSILFDQSNSPENEISQPSDQCDDGTFLSDDDDFDISMV